MATLARDAFALLGLPPRAALTEDEIRVAFTTVAKERHPDGAADEAERASRTAAFTDLTEAQATLLSVPQRLRHLAQQRHPGVEASRHASLSEAMMALFAKVGDAVHAAQAARHKRAQATTALARALLASETMQMQEKLSAASAELADAWGVLESDLAALDASPARPEELLAVAHRAAFLEKWQARLRSRLFSL
jgi:DnaJ-class molecular chaperone